MAWCKTGLSDFLGEFFFSSKVPEFVHVRHEISRQIDKGAPGY